MLIPKELSPNRSRELHWGTVTRAKHQLQEAVRYLAADARVRYQQRTGTEWEPLESAVIYYTFHVPNASYVQDDDNIIASCKHLVDMLQKDYAGIIDNDRGLATGRISWVLGSRMAPLTEVMVTEVKVRND